MATSSTYQTNHSSFDKFSFLSINASSFGDKQDEKSRRRFVRSHAKRAADEQRRSNLNSTSADFMSGSARAPASFSEHVGMFKVASAAQNRAKILRAKPQRQLVVNSVELTTNDYFDNDSKEHKRPVVVPKQLSSSWQLVPSRGHIDPFGTLPVAIGDPEQRLLYYYNSALLESFVAFDPDSKLMLESAADPAWLHATLSLVALYYDLALGNDLSLECLFHRGEALRLVNQRIAQAAEQQIDISTVGAVASLANFDITIGSVNNATTHMNGLQRLVVLLGGLRTLRENQLLQNLATWSDLQCSYAWDSHPRFPYACESPHDALTESCVIVVEMYFVQLQSQSPFGAKMAEIVQIIRHISRIKDSTARSKTGRVELSCCLYMAEYRLLTLFDDASLTGPVMQLCKAWQLATCLYLHVAIRELPVASPAEKVLVERLVGLLDVGSLDFYTEWAENPDVLLWIMFIGGATATRQSERDFFMTQIAKLSWNLGIDSCEGFEARLKNIIWLNRFFEGHCAAIWDEVEKLWSVPLKSLHSSEIADSYSANWIS